MLHPPARPLRDGTIVLRLPRAGDAAALVRYGDDPDLAETVWVPIPTPCSRAVATERLRDFERGWVQENRFGPALIIADDQSDELIGVLFLRVRERDSVELSYGVAPACRNRGVATAAVTLASSWCLGELGAARVELRIGRDNLASQRVATKAGFTLAGTVQSHLAATGATYEDLLFLLRR
jgi:RimJ/RimL family protein N-acetyltransferase